MITQKPAMREVRGPKDSNRSVAVPGISSGQLVDALTLVCMAAAFAALSVFVGISGTPGTSN